MARRGEQLDNAPTPERLSHGGFEYGVEVVTYDSDMRPYRSLASKAIGFVERMAKRGAISDEMVEAAERFRLDFFMSTLDPLRASLMRERVGAGVTERELTFRALRARQRVSDAIAAVGQPGGSCLWAVIGEDRSLKDWGQSARVSDENATGVLISALGTLKAHYRL